MITVIYTAQVENIAVASTKVRTVSDASDVLYMVLTSHYKDADKARVDANSLERAFKDRRCRRFSLSQHGDFTITVTR